MRQGKIVHLIDVEPLTQARFVEFGDVLDTEGSKPIAINQGFAERVNGLAQIDVSAEGGTVNVSIFNARARSYPMPIDTMERHPLGSQLFVPMQNSPWLVLVCKDPVNDTSYRAFRATGRQGVNYARGVWHHPLLVLSDNERFLVIDRVGPGSNLEEARMDAGRQLHLAMPRQWE